MSRHCQHSSTARTCAIFAYLLLACSECHELFNHEASQSNCGACLSAAADKVDFLYSACADVKMPQFNSSEIVPNIIGMALSYICQKAKTIVVLVVCCSQRPELRWLPHLDRGNPPVRAPFGARQVHTEEYKVAYNNKPLYYVYVIILTITKLRQCAIGL
jgi:hypothetical protein